MRIAGSRTDEDWKARKSLLQKGGKEAWAQAFDDFFMGRLQTRYFDPIEALCNSRKVNGEGFAIVALQCSLIEFLGATIEGKSYRHKTKETKLGRFEYDGSKAMFMRFLTSVPPFKTVFDRSLAKNFYEGVRCGLLHEASTKNGWTIRTRCGVAGPFVDPKKKIVFRDDLQRAFAEFVEWYRAALLERNDYQAAFIRKFDSLCIP